MTINLPTTKENYVINNQGTLYHLVDLNPDSLELGELTTPCGQKFDLESARVPINTPKNRTDLLCKRCQKIFKGI